MTRTRDPGYSRTRSGRSSLFRTSSSREGDECDDDRNDDRDDGRDDDRDDDERGHGRHRYGHDEDDEAGYDDADGIPSKQPNRDSDRSYRDDEEIDLDLETDLDIMEVLDVDDLKQMDGPDA